MCSCFMSPLLLPRWGGNRIFNVITHRAPHCSPLVQVGQQAEAFRGLADIEPLPETGPRELVLLARNFNTMADEIALLLANRTTLMAGISHDLERR